MSRILAGAASHTHRLAMDAIPMNLVEREYRTRLGRLSGRERVALAVDLHRELCVMIRRRILANQPGLAEQEVRRRVAEAVYRTDPAARRLLSLLDESRSDE